MIEFNLKGRCLLLAEVGQPLDDLRHAHLNGTAVLMTTLKGKGKQ